MARGAAARCRVPSWATGPSRLAPDRMAADGSHDWIAADVGNSRIKLGYFAGVPDAPLPEPAATIEIDAAMWDPARLAQWHHRCAASLGRTAGQWEIASVNSPALDRLLAWVRRHHASARIRLLQSADLPLAIDLNRPQQVGIDRLLAAVAANRLRGPSQPAICVDLGTAVTVDKVSADGHFLGGAIAPGIAMGAQALHDKTDRLPHVVLQPDADPPPPLGRDTVAAIESGLFWGTVGTIRQLVAKLSGEEAGTPAIFVTGGASPRITQRIDPTARFVPHLVLAGIAVARASCP